MLGQRFEPRAAAEQDVVDAQSLGLFAELLPLPLQNIALPLVLFEFFVQFFELLERAGFERDEPGKAFELVVELVALGPQRLQVDGDFEPACPSGEFLRRRLSAVDFVGNFT